MSKAKQFNEKFAEYKAMIESGKMPDVVFVSQLMLLAHDVVSESEDVAGPAGEVDYSTMISQLGKNVGGLLGDINITKAEADREEYLKKYSEAIEEEAKAKKNSAEVLAGTVVGLAVTAMKLAV